MKTATKLAAIFCLAAAMTGCVPAPSATETAVPDATVSTSVTNAAPANVVATTQIGSNYLYEIAPPNSPNTTCFMYSSIYTGSAVSGSVDCVAKPAGAFAAAVGKAVIESVTKIGANTFYEVTPASRPDLRCFMSSSVYTGSAVSGSVKCLPKTGL
jgi:hypothetical protein